jgi:plasmid stabilization system protein ParE
VSKGYRLTPEALACVEEICAFIAEDGVDAALHVLDEFERAFDQLAASPEMGHRREDLTARPVKFWSVDSYLIVYDPVSTPLTVIAVLHGARDVKALLKEPGPETR